MRASPLKSRPEFLVTTVTPVMRAVVELSYDGGFSFIGFQDLCSYALITYVLERFNYNQSRAAGALGMHRNTLAAWMEHLGIPSKQQRTAKKRVASARPRITVKAGAA